MLNSKIIYKKYENLDLGSASSATGVQLLRYKDFSMGETGYYPFSVTIYNPQTTDTYIYSPVIMGRSSIRVIIYSLKSNSNSPICGLIVGYKHD